MTETPTTAPLAVTPENYHSLPVMREWMSNSQWKQWLACAAASKAAMEGKMVRLDTADDATVDAAKAAGLVVVVPSTALLVGSYVDRALTCPSELPAWLEAHRSDAMKEVGKAGSKTWALRADFEQANGLIDRVKADPMYKQVCDNCAAQVVLSGRIGEENWLYMADWLDEERHVLLDLKTAADFEDKRCPEEMLWDGEYRTRYVTAPWYDVGGYWRQLAVGRELYHQKHGVYPVCALLAVTKQDPPNLGMFVLDNALRFEREIAHIKNLTADVFAWKRGTVPPPECGDCEWCRANSSFENEQEGKSGRVYTV